MPEDQARTARPRWSLLEPLPAKTYYAKTCYAAEPRAAFETATGPAATREAA